MMKQTLRLVMYTYRKIRNALIITQQIASSPPSTQMSMLAMVCVVIGT